MSVKLSDLKSRIRRELGDPIRAKGTAESGSGLTLIKDTDVFVQEDNYWQNKTVHIESAGSEAPEGEFRRILSSDQSAKTVTTEPFTVAVDSGDTFSIAFFSDYQLRDIINDAIKELDRNLPYKTVVNLTVQQDVKRYDIPTGVLDIFRIYYLNDSDKQEWDYDNWQIEGFDRKIVFGDWWSETRVLNLACTKERTMLSAGTSFLINSERLKNSCSA
jgi:hypothetical protein